MQNLRNLLSEENISVFLGILIVLTVGILIFNYYKNIQPTQTEIQNKCQMNCKIERIDDYQYLIECETKERR